MELTYFGSSERVRKSQKGVRNFNLKKVNIQKYPKQIQKFHHKKSKKISPWNLIKNCYY